MAAEKVSRARCYPHSFGTTSGPCKHETPQCNGLGQQFAEHVANTVAESHWQTARSVACARGLRYGRRGRRGVDGRWWGEDLLAEQVSASHRHWLHVGFAANPLYSFGPFATIHEFHLLRPHHYCICRRASFSHRITHSPPCLQSSRADTRISNILAGLAGITSDANSLVNFARNSAQRHLFTYDDDIPVEMLVQRLCDMKQGYTQFGGA
jgi:hypothetical protein